MAVVLELALGVLIAMALVMSGGWAFQRAVKDGGWVDAFWTFGTGATLALAALAPFGPEAGAPWRRAMAAALVAVWGLRLGSYVALRVARSPSEDPRYAGFRQEWGPDFQRRMYGLVIAQAPFTALLTLSVVLAARAPSPTFGWRDALALAIFAVALAGEALADDQMRRFRADPANKGKICEVGLWRVSRHPNYFCEAAVWLTWPAMGLDLSRPWTLLTLVAPAIMYGVVRYVSGVPPLEEAMLRSRGEAYRDYQRRVSVLIPLPPKS